METIIENGKTSAIVVKEDPATVKSMWGSIVDLKVKSNQVFIKGVPVVFAASSVFAPEAAPVLLSVSSFFTTDTGKKILSFMSKTEEIAGDVWKGNAGVAGEKVNKELDGMLEEEVNQEQVVKDISVLK